MHLTFNRQKMTHAEMKWIENWNDKEMIDMLQLFYIIKLSNENW